MVSAMLLFRGYLSNYLILEDDNRLDDDIYLDKRYS
jgi:hypothetical protein